MNVATKGPFFRRETTDEGAVEVFDRPFDDLLFVRVVPNGLAGHTYAGGEQGAPASNDPDELMAWGLAKLATS